jgi:signal transduction histidine kinase
MKKCLLVILLLNFIQIAFTQDPAVLQQQYKAANSYPDKIYALDALANYYVWTEGGYGEANTYGQQMISLAKESTSKELLAKSYILNGIRLVEAIPSTKRNEEARAYFGQAIEIAKGNKLPFYEASAYIGLSGIQFHLVVGDGDEMLRWGRQALALSTAIANDSLSAMSLIAIAIGHQLKKDNVPAFRHFTEAVQLAEAVNDPYVLAYCHRAFARYYHQLGDDKALAYYSKAVEILRAKKNLTYREVYWMYLTQWNTTWVYNDKKEYEKARASADKLIEWSKEYNLPSTYRIAPLSQHLSLYISESRFDEAKAFISKNPRIEAYFVNHDYLNTFYRHKADIYKNTNQFDSADHYYRLVLAAIPKFAAVWSPDAYREYGNFLMERGRLQEAIQQLETAKQSSEKFKNLSVLVASYRDLEKAYYSIGNIEKAYQYQSHYVKLKDSLAQLSKEKELALLEAQQEQTKLEQELRQRQALAEYRNRIRTISLIGGLAVLFIVAGILWRNNRQKHKANLLLQKQKQETEQQKAKAEFALEELKTTQTQLVQREKMASLGELTAGIAHEIQNPLNFVNNFAEVNSELIEEITKEAQLGNVLAVLQIAEDLKGNEEKIAHHGKRADAIVKGMLQHSRVSTGDKQLTDINALTEEYLRLTYHAIRAKDKNFNATLQTDFDNSIGQVNVVPQDIGRVLLNLFNNAFYALQQKKQQLNGTYEPTIQVSTRRLNGQVEVTVRDNGIGIPQKASDKIFQPFFTTKPAGEGAGLGLSLAYDIITKGHGGQLKVNTEEGGYSEFVVQLPVTN